MSKSKVPPFSPDDTLAESGQALLRHYARVLLPTQKPSEVSEASDGYEPVLSAKRIKSMRVATRRMRGVLRLFEPYFKRKVSKALYKPLRELAGLTGRTRDWHLMIEAAEAHVLRCDDDGKQAIQPMIDYWRAEHKQAVIALETYCQSNAFAKWQAQINELLTADPSSIARAWEVGEPLRLRHVLEAWLWQHIADVRAYDELPDHPTPEQVHALRIAIKNLRYLLDALQSLMPTRQAAWAARLHRQCVLAQDAYGLLNDAHTHETYINAFVEGARQRGLRIPLQGIRVYATEQHRLVEEQTVKWRSYLTSLIKTQ